MSVRASVFVTGGMRVLAAGFLGGLVLSCSRPVPPGAAPRAEAGPAEVAAPAMWRHERPLSLLVFSGKNGSLASYQRIARRLRATLSVRYTDIGGDSIYHVNDKWIEPKDNPTADELAARVAELAGDALKLRDGRPPADVIFCSRLDLPGLLECVRAGAVLVTCGSVYPAADSPLAAEWPAKPTPRNSWMSGGATRADGPTLAGLPLHRLAGHTWIPLAEATEGSQALATGECGAAFSRRVGDGAILFVPTGPVSRHHAAVALHGRVYDHDEIWLRFWDQLLYETVRGAEAMPAYADLRPGDAAAPPGATYSVPGRLVNRSAAGPLGVAVRVTTPRGETLFSRTETVEVPPGGEREYAVAIPVDPSWGTGLYPVCLSVGEAAGGKVFHQALEFIPVSGSVAMQLQPERKGYRLGEEAQWTLTASSADGWNGDLHFGVYDFRGRLLGVSRQPAVLGAEPQSFTFTWPLVDHGVRVDTFRAEVVARRDGRDWGRAEAKVYKYEPWSMRNEYQWSTWAGIACAAPSLVPPAMRLMAHAGMNALGYPGRNELSYAAERWGWRYYNEGVGMNTFSPVIEYENDAEIEAALLKEAGGRFESPDLNSAAFVLASVGEEAGYKTGWGRTYYWDTPVAPDKACRAFQWFLKTRYGELARLNATWHTAYATWDEVKLTREFSGAPPKLEADGWAHPSESPVGGEGGGVSLAPYTDTTQFYAWYYDRLIAVAQRILRERINPVPLTMASAPASWIFASRECQVRLAGPGAWNESQMHALMDGPEPGFGLIWGHFDWSVKTDNMFWGFLLARSGHNNYWVDVPLMFNNDLTHTRSSFAMRRWTHRLAGHERLILDSRPAPSDVGLLGDNGLGLDSARGNMTTSLKVALCQGGFGLPGEGDDSLDGRRIVFAVGRQAVSAAEAERLHSFVEAGGTLVFTPRFATQDEFGAPQPVSPGQGLAAKWGLRVTERTDPASRYYPVVWQSFPLDGVASSLKGLPLATHSVFREKVSHDGWQVLAEYADGVPGILSRPMGRGRLVYVNAIYQSHHYIQWVTPTGAERQGFYKLVEWLCEEVGARRFLRLEGDLAQVLHMAVKEFTDATGRIRYAIVRTSGEVPWAAGKLQWLGPQQAGYDVLGGQPAGRTVALNLEPGGGRLFAFVKRPLKRLRVSATPARIEAGQPVRVAVEVLGADGRPVPGCFPFELRVLDGDGREIEGLQRSFSAESGGAIPLNTALDDPAGRWTLRLTDGICGLSAEDSVRVRAPEALAAAPGCVPWGWPSEIEEPAALPDAQFIERLQALSALHRTDHSAEGWMVKQRLGYYYDFFPDTRHAILRPLLDLDWNRYNTAIRVAVTAGAELILTGEDSGLHPGSGLTVHPHREPTQLQGLVTALHGAEWSLASRDGDTICAALGKGRVILCRESIDAAGHDSPAVAGWQQRWLAELRPGHQPIPPPSLGRLTDWLTGRQALTDQPRTVTWLDGNRREITLQLKPQEPLGQVFTLIVPPTGEVQEVALTVGSPPDSAPAFDVGADGTPDTDWTAAVARWARETTVRDDSGWRRIPIRVTAPAAAEIRVGLERLTVR